MGLTSTRITILGSGTSTGIPMVGCTCAVCRSPDPKDQRLRTSVLITAPSGQRLLADCGPDLRTQLLREDVRSLEAVFLSHTHADHLHGLDDIRPLTYGPPRKSIPIWCSPKVRPELETRFPYIFKSKQHFAGKPVLGGGIPLVELKDIPLEQEFEILPGLPVTCFEMPHGYGSTLALVGASFAYAVDCHDLPPKLLAELQARRLELLILDCVQKQAHDTHLSAERALHFARLVGAKRTGLIHMNHELGHAELTRLAQEAVGPQVFPLYDRQQLDC